MKPNLLKKKIKTYLKYLNYNKPVRFIFRRCDICGSKKNTIIKETISWNRKKYGYLPIVACDFCGFIFQKLNFSKEFYFDFYSNFYRKIIFKDPIPSKKFLIDQKKRGQGIYNFVKKYFKKKGSMLDVGASTGLMLSVFKDNGWKVKGNDPDVQFVNYGNNKLKLKIDSCQAEDMKYNQKFDLILIMGSLEHCYDPNLVLKKCAEYSKKGSILVLECRGDPQGKIKKYFNHNHHRYFNGNTQELIMIKHGWKPYLTTQNEITGPTRQGGYFTFGRYLGKNNKVNISRLIQMGKKETVETVKNRFIYFDALAHKKKSN